MFGLAIGKAAIPMMDALAERIPLAGGLAVTKFAPERSRRFYPVLEGGHPVPDERSLEAGERALGFVSSLNEDDTLVCLISGGGSALVTAPYVPLEDLQSLTSLLLASGAPIDEINTLRRQLDRIKGGGLAGATKAKVISLILSDVIGNPLEAIASGPTVPDPTTREDAMMILKKYELEKQVPNTILAILESKSSLALPDTTLGLAGSARVVSEAERSGEAGVLLDFRQQAVGLQNVQNMIIGDNKLASRAALKQAEQEGFQAEILTNGLQGEAREAGRALAHRLRVESSAKDRPFCLIAGGETTVTLTGNGKGGRNQELALSAVEELRGLENVMLITLGTDGDDGPTDAAGAVVTEESASRAESIGLDAEDHLSRNDAYPFFEALGDLLKPGPTGTNVNDLVFLFAI